MPEKLPLVELDDAVLLQMMQNPMVTAKFPFLASTLARGTAKALTKPCKRCTKRHRQAPSIDYELVKRQLGELPAAQKGQLLGLLNTQRIVVKYQNARGQRIKLLIKN